jgi:outer membrane protein OmpA-like peptidoglycan-associated protein/ABC-type nitrate/sulfonate/bicarbonate transport system substrate-binding protein
MAELYGTEKRARKWIRVALAWLVLLAIGLAGYIFLAEPYLTGKLVDKTGSRSQYSRGTLKVALDNYAGYSIFRAEEFREGLKAQGIGLELKDDKGDYQERLKALKNGEVQIAVFPINSLIQTGAGLGEYPATIFLIINKSFDADGIVAYEDAFSSLQDLANPETVMVLTPDSPSEYLARVVMSHFSITIPASRWEKAEGSTAVYDKFKSAARNVKKAFVMWDPDLTRALEFPGAKLLLGSSKLEGHIVDTLVVSRRFLADHPEIVKAVTETYLKTAYFYQRQPEGLLKLIQADVKKESGVSLNPTQAKRIADHIQWTNTTENFYHFGVIAGQEGRGLSHVEDMIVNITKVLNQTGALPSNPLAGKESTIYHKDLLMKLKEENFHPGRIGNLLANEAGLKGQDEKVRGTMELPALSDDQWSKLLPVGQLRVRPISFGRGKAMITIDGQVALDELAGNLKSWPGYYLKVVGYPSSKGDRQANRELALARANGVVEYLISGGVSESRVKAVIDTAEGRSETDYTVGFALGEPGY